MDSYHFIGAFVDDLARGGLRHVCICPGSRSTPLAIAFALHPAIRVWMHLDERSAAFFALGLALSTETPTAMVCTSGTAAANFMPALVEARHGRVPLLALTADRPAELRDCGAPQTIDQIRFFGAQVKWAVEMPLPEASETMLRYARTAAARALAAAREAPAGPVHLNFPLREPLVPPDGALPLDPSAAGYGRPEGRPYVHVESGDSGAAADAPIVAGGELPGRGLIVCGPGTAREVRPASVAALAAALGYPILADPLSGLRCGNHDRARVIDAHDAFLRDERFAEQAVPDMVLRFGAAPTSKPLQQYLARHHEARLAVVDRAGWRDPTLLAAEMVRMDPDAFCAALPALAARRPDGAWQELWVEAQRRTRAALASELAAIEEPFEGRAMAELADLLPDGATLVAGNSMPVRDIDTFFHGSGRAIRILGNRGASGIDGVVSTALGVAAGGSGPTVLAIGDISLYHDGNGLLAARRHGLDLTIVLLNNDGGGIFSFLPQASLPGREGEALFETLFGTPHGLHFAHLAALYGGVYAQTKGWEEFRSAVRSGLRDGGLHIIEVPTDRIRNVALHRRCWPAVTAALADLVFPAEEGRR